MKATHLLLASLLTTAPLYAADALVKVVLGKASAPANTALPRGSTFSTGKKSRSEVALSAGTFRTGSDTTVQIADDDAVTLKKGLTLVASKPKTFRGSVQVRTPDHGIKVRGTAQVYYDPGRSIRVVVLEGSVTVSLNSLRGEALTLKRGQELIINPVDHRLPTPVEVDLDRLMSTMALLDKTTFPISLPTTEHVTASAALQQEELTHGEELDSTGLTMYGASPEVELPPEEIIHAEAHDEIDDLDGDGEPDPNLALDENGVPLNDPEADTEDAAAADDNADSATADDSTDDTTDDGTTKNARHRKALRPREKSAVISLNGEHRSANQINLGSSTTRSRIYISNSSEVAALAGAIHALSKGGLISVDSSTLKAKTEILLDTSASSAGIIQLRNATLNADTIRARAFATGGDALIIDGSTLTASQLIKLYAEGTGTLRFRNNVTLDTPQAILSGHTVEVEPGGNVNVRGKADVYTNNPRFNTTGQGNINAGNGVTTRPFNQRPGF